jgi:hypothetical protein
VVVFVLGTGRCGSTLVQEVMAKHPGTGYLLNLEDRLPGVRLGRTAAALYRRLPPEASRKGRLRLAPTEGYRALADRVSPVLAEPTRDLVAEDATPWLVERTREFFDAAAARHRAPVFLHKFTGWPRSGFLSQVWPDARFVHVVRDGRAVANSLLQMPWWRGYTGGGLGAEAMLPAAYRERWLAEGRSFPVLAGLEWAMLMDSFADARAKAAEGHWLELRYEDVVADPQQTFARALEFCGLEPSPAFDRALARYRFAAGRTDAFRRDLRPDDVAALTRVLHDHLEAYGYPVEDRT